MVVPFTISCGACLFCQKGLFSLCDTSNPNAEIARKAMGHSPAGLFGTPTCWAALRAGRRSICACLSPMSARSRSRRPPRRAGAVPLRHLPDRLHGGRELRDRDGRHGRGLGMRAGRAIRDPERLDAGRRAGDRHRPRAGAATRWPEKHGKAETINFDEEKVYDRLMEMTKGRGPDRCIDAVGCEAHAGGSFDAVLDKAKAAVDLGTDRAHVLREAIMCCRKGGTLSVPGVYVGFPDKMPFGAPMNKGLTVKTGQTHVHHTCGRFWRDRRRGDRPVIRDHPPAETRRRPRAYKTFRDKKDGCIKVVMTP